MRQIYGTHEKSKLVMSSQVPSMNFNKAGRMKTLDHFEAIILIYDCLRASVTMLLHLFN